MRFYGVHIWILPAVLFLLVGFHVLAVIRQGIAARPRLTPLTEPVAGESRRAAYERDYAAEKRAGKPFLEALYADAVVSLGVFILLVVLAIALGAPLDEPADPNSVGYVPRPEAGNSLALFELLWYFTGPLEPLMITGFFTIAAVVFVLVPFLIGTRSAIRGDDRWRSAWRGSPSSASWASPSWERPAPPPACQASRPAPA